VKWKALTWLAGTLAGVAIGALLAMSTARAGGSVSPPAVERGPDISKDRDFKGGFIDRQTAIEMCVQDVQEIQATGEVPEAFARHKRFLRGVKHQLQKEGFKNWKDLMWGAAIKVCMQDEGYHSICVSKSGREGDLQFLETAKAPSCWDLAAIEEPVRPAPIPAPVPAPIPCEVWNPACNPRPVVLPPPQQQMVLPPMSPADLAQFNEDMAVITQPPTSVFPGGGNVDERFGSCHSYWQSLSYNRSPEARQVLFAVRVARCMYRTGFAVSRCPMDFGSMVQPRCYARF
jgi:hypothetical protein